MRIAVENTGIVITPVDVEKLFIALRQLDATEVRIKAAVRREEVERLIGATLQVKSAMGTGSIILLTFAGYDHARAGVAQAWRRARLICTC